MHTPTEPLDIKSLIHSPVQKLTKEHLAIQEVFDAAYSKTYTQGEIQHLLKNSPIEFLEEHMEFMVSQGNISIENIPSIFLEDYNIAALYVKEDVANMVMLPKHFKDNEEFIHEMALYNGRIIHYATERIQHIEEILNTALNNTKKSFQYFPDIFKTKENSRIALTGSFPDYADNWQYVPHPLCLNLEFVYEIGAFCPKIYKHLDPILKNDYQITEFFLSKDGSNLQYIPEELKNNPILIQPTLFKQPVFLRFAGDILKNDPDFILPIITKVPYELHVCGEAIKSNLAIAKQFCNIHMYQPAIDFFDEEIKSNVTVAMIAILRNPESMNYISKTLSSNFDFVSLYIEQQGFNSMALHYISNDLKNNSALMMKAYDRDPCTLEYVESSLKYSNTFLDYVFSPFNQGKTVPQSTLLSNLQSLKLKTGDEGILLNFCNSSKLDFNDIQIKANILRQINDHSFVNLLKEQHDMYAYLKSATLQYSLEQSLPIKKIKSIKSKI